MSENQKLVQDCKLIKQVIQDGMKWVTENAEEDKQEVTVANLKTFRRHANRFEAAVIKRPSIAIFGQSQVGKSYLVSNLTKQPEAMSLMVKVPGTDENVDFIEKINPPGGGKEATGLVSRFTTVDSFRDGWQPYELKLFSQSDVAKIITNGYMSDITHYTYAIDKTKIQKKLAALQAGMSQSVTPGFSEDAVYDLKEYINFKFRDHFLVRDLNNINFWDDIAEVIPYIDSQSRWEILEFLWGGQEFFTEIFKKLSFGLKEVNFLPSVRCELAALTPQLDTILDVERLRELYKSAKKPPVNIYEGGTKIATLERSILSALTAEAVLPLSDETANHQSRTFLKDADVLDFPGARSRQQIPEVTFEEKENDDKLLVFLRGKVAFLFDRYNINYEISTLLFCMDDKQPEVADLPKFLYEWIKNTHGDSPEKREKRERKLEMLVPQKSIEDLIPLLVVFTKFNIELAGNPATEKPGELGPHKAKWTARVGANFADQMGISVGDNWIDNWNSDGTFKNLFPLRDPKWSKTIYDGFDTNNGKETAIKEDYVEKMKDMQKAWVNHKDVIRHFHNPLEAWREATELNKSGLSYIVKYLTPTCNPIIKREQIKGQIDDLKNKLYSELKAFYQGGTIEEKLKKARINAAQVFMNIMKMQKENNTFGNFVEKMVINDDLSWKIYFDMMMKKQIDGKEQIPTKQVEAQDKTIPLDLIEMLNQFIEIDDNEDAPSILAKLKDFFGIEDDQALKEVLDDSGIDIQALMEAQAGGVKAQEEYDKAYIFAGKLLSRWLMYIEDLKSDEVLLDLGLRKNIADLVIQEMNKNKNRVNLKKIIADNTREHVETFQLTSNIDIVARISASIINKFVNTLGWAYISSSERPKVKKNDATPIFTELSIRAPEKKDLKLGIEFPGKKFFVEWTTGIRNSFEANVYYEEDVKDAERAEADAKLGSIIEKVK